MSVHTTTPKATGCLLGNAEEVNSFASERDAIEHGIKVIKEQIKYWDWALSENCTDESSKTAVRAILDFILRLCLLCN